LVAASAYALIWGASWLAGDRSTAFFGRVDGRTFSAYPGVLFGGLPPAPSMDTDLPQLLAAVAGLGGLALLAAIALRGRRRTD
jgi:hypothetical protein